jgi:DNA modification methylase
MTTIKDLKFDDKNFNKHTEFGMSLLEKSLRENGAGRSILLDKDNNIIAGNGIVEAAGQIGLENVKIVEATGDEIIAVKRTDVSLNSKKGREMALADNATAAVDLDWDDEAIKSEFTEEETKGWGVDLDWKDVEEITEDEAPEVNESEPANSEIGRVYQLGEHRLMCGDSTDAGSVAILMDGQKADMVFTDPPYGNGESGKYGRSRLGVRTILGDESLEAFNGFMDIIPTDKIIYFLQWRTLAESIKVAETKGLKINTVAVWDKKNAGLNGAGGISEQWEAIVFAGNIKYRKFGGNVFSISREQHKREDSPHPHQKPIKLLAELFDFVDGCNTILDPFGGSGSTLIACEQLGRECFMMELDPKYCDVIRKRYWKFKTGSEEGWQDGTKAIL